MTRKTWLALGATLLVPIAAFAGESPEDNKITVVVRGRAEAQAAALEVELTVSAQADGAADAERRYREKLKNVLSSLRDGKSTSDDEAPKKKKPAKKAETDEEAEDPEAPKKRPARKKKVEEEDEGGSAKTGDRAELDAAARAIPIEVHERGFQYSAGGPKKAGGGIMVFPGQEEAKPEALSRFECKVVVTIKDVAKHDRAALARRVALVIDAAAEAGGDTSAAGDSSAPVLRFVVGEPEALRKKAYEDAMAKAKTRAATLADLSGRKVVGVVRVSEVSMAAAAASSQPSGMFGFLSMLEGAAREQGKKSALEVADEVELSVTFTLS